MEHIVDDEQFTTKFEEPYKKISNDVKFYMCLQNHDYGNNLDLTNNSQHQIDYGIHSQKEGKKWVMPSKYYTFKKKNIQFFVMDTNFDFMDDEEIKEQLDYLVREINKSKKPWKILIGHHTLRSVGGMEMQNQVKKWKIFKNYLRNVKYTFTYAVMIIINKLSKQLLEVRGIISRLWDRW